MTSLVEVKSTVPEDQSKPFLDRRRSSARPLTRKNHPLTVSRQIYSTNSNSDFLDLDHLNRRFLMRRKLLMLGSVTFGISSFALLFLLFHQVILPTFDDGQMSVVPYKSPLVSVVLLFGLSVVVNFTSLFTLCPLTNATLTSHYCQLFHHTHQTKQPQSPQSPNTQTSPSLQGRLSRSNSSSTNPVSKVRCRILLFAFNSLFVLLWACCTLIVFNLVCIIFVQESKGLSQTDGSTFGSFVRSWNVDKWINFESIDVYLLTMLFVILYAQFVLPFTIGVNFFLQLICFTIYVSIELLSILVVKQKPNNSTLVMSNDENTRPDSDFLFRKVNNLY